MITRTTCLAAATCPYTDPPAPPAPAPPGPDVRAPKLLLGGATRQRFLRGRAIYVYAKCDEVCTIRASERHPAALQIARTLRTASVKKTLRPGARTKISDADPRSHPQADQPPARARRAGDRAGHAQRGRRSGNRTSQKRLLTLVRRSR